MRPSTSFTSILVKLLSSSSNQAERHCDSQAVHGAESASIKPWFLLFEEIEDYI